MIRMALDEHMNPVHSPSRPAPAGGDVLFLPPAYTLPETF